MELFASFKRDYFNYLVSIILPALISGLSIPLFKHILGSAGYGSFALWFNAILILTAVLSGWIAQSVIRYFPSSKNQLSFSLKALFYSLKTQSIFFLPVIIVVFWISNDWILGILCGLTLFLSSLQFTILSIAQSSFLSKKIIFSELIRILIYVGGSTAFLIFTNITYLYSLFIAIILSYLVSGIYLFLNFKSKLSANTFKRSTDPTDWLKKFYHYGLPLSMWFIFSYLLTYIDKLFSLNYFGSHLQGNYQALFDFLNKSLTLVISPVISSVFPLLTNAYEKNNRKEIKALLKRLAFYEIIGFVSISIGYWIIGAKIIFFILNIPDNLMYRVMGFIIICSAFIWQLSILAQKRLELKYQSRIMVKFLLIAFFAQVLFYLVTGSHGNQLTAPFGFLLSSTIYLILISIPQIQSLFKNAKSWQKFGIS